MLEQLCRYITRPALANERVQTNAAGQVVLKLKTAWRDGTTHLVMSPPEFMERHIDGQLCGVAFYERYVDCGSEATCRLQEEQSFDRARTMFGACRSALAQVASPVAGYVSSTPASGRWWRRLARA